MCFENPQATSPTTSEGQTLAAEVKYAPQVYASNAEYAPAYTQLDMQDMNTFLNGSNGTPGYLSEYANEIMPQLTAAQTTANTALRTANIADAQDLSGAYTQAERTANPQAAGLLDQLSQTAGQQLSYGTNLTPSQQFQTDQSTRSAEAARGLGYGPSDVFAESLADTNEGQNLLSEREGLAGSTAGALQSFYGNPVAAISGMGSNATMSSSGVSSLASSSGSNALSGTSSEFNPANSVSTTDQNQLWEAAQSNAANDNLYPAAFGNGMSSY